MKATFEQQE